MRAFRYTRAYKKDLKRISRRGYDLDLLASVLNTLRAGHQLPPARCDHPLRGDWKGWRECHIEPDWLLIYRATDTEVQLARTGTHADRALDAWCSYAADRPPVASIPRFALM